MSLPPGPLPPLPEQPAAPEPTRPARAPKAAPAAALAQVIPSVSAATAASYQAFESVCGGRASLVAKLALVASSKDEEYIVGLLADPRYDAEPLAGLCRIGKISLRRLMELYRDAALVSAQVGAIDKVAQGLTGVAADVMARAVTHYVTCHGCQGTGTFVPEPTKDKPNPQSEPCRTCRGVGQLEAQPEHEVQKTALQLGGLLKKDGTSGGITIQQNNQQLNLAGGSAGFDDLVEKMDEVLFGSARERVSQRVHTAHVDPGTAAPATDDIVEGETLDGPQAAPPEAAPPQAEGAP
jgi:hypothetical protein